MSPQDARTVIDSLANGIDPATGEVLPSENPFNNARVIRALFVAVTALEKAVKQERRNSALPEKAGLPWSEQEDEELTTLFDSGNPLGEMAKRHGRTEGAIASRLVRLGRIKEVADARRAA